MTGKFLVIGFAYILAANVLGALIDHFTGWGSDNVTTYVMAGMIGLLLGQAMDGGAYGGPDWEEE